jgi:Tfp pilus assembly protein PilO
MNRNIIGFIILLAFVLGMSQFYTKVYVVKPDQFKQLDKELIFQKEKLISAQILASELDRVATLIERNLAASAKDSLAEEASIPFLNEMIDELESLKCQIISMKTFPRDRTVKEYIRTPYFVEFKGTYNTFGEFINRMEKSERLVTLEKFKIDNNLTQLNFARTFDDLKTHLFTVKLSTLTLVRSDSKIGASK